eukprot:TRINITY_DN14981_c0_g3_i2.p1 TRINITY_DN14981_c0_g3~~TRINITY_DN14981_c0_g3_i2.p1  ORF type:complete len:919 (-),score=178.38 TRINITY_DN14981_c0_g3_i2:267-3023(-)
MPVGADVESPQRVPMLSHSSSPVKSVSGLESEASLPLAPKWFNLLRLRPVRLLILLWWLAWAAAGASLLLPYFALVGWNAVLSLPSSLPGKVAMRELYKYFPEATSFCNVGLLRLACDPDADHTCPTSTAAAGSEELLRKLRQKVQAFGAMSTFDSRYGSLIMGHERSQPSPAHYVTPDGRAEAFAACEAFPSTIMAEEILEVLKTENKHPEYLSVGVTARSLLATGSIDAVKRDLPLIDCICVPLAFVIMGSILRSAKLLLIAFMNLLISVMAIFAVLYLICQNFALVPDPTQVNFVSIIALGLNFDYSLFLLTRFNAALQGRHRLSEEGNGTVKVEEAVLEMLRGVTSVILSSGLTLCVVFCGFLTLSAGNLVMAGMGCAVATMVVMIVALTAVPAILLTFPTCFAGGTTDGLLSKEQGDESGPLGGLSDNQRWHALRPEQADALRSSRQVAVWRFLSTWPYNLVVVLTLQALAICAGLPALRLRLNNDISEIAPRSSTAYQTLQELVQLTPRFPDEPASGKKASEDFPGFVGLTDEFFVLAQALPKDVKIDTKKTLMTCGYELTAEIAQRLLALPAEDIGFQLQPSAIFAPGFARGKVINRTAMMAWQGEGGFSDDEEDLMVTYFADSMRKCVGNCFSKPSDYGATGTIVAVRLPVNPSSADGDRFIVRARRLLADLEQERPERFGCDGVQLRYHLADAQSTVVNHDLMRRTFGEFKRALPITMGLIFLMIGIFLRSAFVPVRLALTLVLPLCSVFGVAVLVFQDGWLDWMGLANVGSSADLSFHWEVPIFSFALTIALALDYDLFVVIRVADYRFAGYDIQGSIIRALHETGPVVTGAGLIMALSFGGNLLAESTTLNQGGWLLAIGVLVDTFVVRTLLVPALLSLADKATWWPSQPPTEGLLDEFGVRRRDVA